MIEEQPCAMFPNGPVCTIAGCPSAVCTRFGFSASFSSTIIAPTQSSSLARTGRSPSAQPTTISERRSLRSS